jgi:thioredoxin-like negative regulator of GroEL
VPFHVFHKATKVKPGRLTEILGHYTVPVLVEFAEKDSPACRLEEPVLTQVLRHFADRLGVVQTDVLSSQEDAERFGVAAVPTFVLFVDGKERLRLVGYQTAEQLIKQLEQVIPPDAAESPTPSGQGSAT